MEIYTIGFTQRSAEGFFGALREAGVKRLVDVRLRPSSQLSGFAKRDDLSFFLRELANIAYVAEPLLVPTPEMLHAYRAKEITWDTYELQFRKLMDERKPEEQLAEAEYFAPSVLLCSEAEPLRCHRRIVAERLAAKWGVFSVVHL